MSKKEEYIEIDLDKEIAENEAMLVYFSHDDCNVCKVLKPKVQELLEDSFPGMKFVYVNTHKQPDEAASKQVFAVPTILVYFEQREYFRFGRNVSLGELEAAIARPYGFMFE
jgi:thiol-disulfide isomerase/thioredoxin